MTLLSNSSTKLGILNEALFFFHVPELKELGLKLQLPIDGAKGTLIARIVHYLKTGKIQKTPKLPTNSCAEKGKVYPLKPDTLLLKGSYKNDLATRQFFKKLIGPHFHFTAFGIDWIKNRWLIGNPPTYQEFASFWQQEKTRREKQKAKPKEEWAYISFTQKFLAKNPKADRETLLIAWEKVRLKKVKIAKDILKEVW